MNEEESQAPLSPSEPAPQKKEPGFLDILVATQQQNNYGYRLIQHGVQEYNPFSDEDPGGKFDLNTLKGTRYEGYSWALYGASNLEAKRRLDQIEKDENNMEILHNAPWYKELAASLTLPFTDPTVWASAALGGRVAVAARAGLMLAAAPAAAVSATGLIASGVAFGAAHWAIANYTKRATSDVSEETSWQQMMVDTTLGMALEFGIGKIFSKSRFKKTSKPETGKPLVDIESSIIDEAKEDGKNLANRISGKDISTAEFKRQYIDSGMAFYHEKPGVLLNMLNRFTHGWIGFASYSNKVIARGGFEAQRALAEMKVLDRNTAINKAGYASQVALEARIARSVSERVGTFEEAFAAGFEKSAIRDRNDFSRELFRAYLSEGQHNDEGVSIAARRLLSDIGEPIQKDLFNLGVTNVEKPQGESAYLPIIYDTAKVMGKDGQVNDKFFDFMRNYLKGEQAKKAANLEVDRAIYQQRENDLLAAMEQWEMQRGSIKDLSSVLQERRDQVKTYRAERKEKREVLAEARRKLRSHREDLRGAKTRLAEAESAVSGEINDKELDISMYSSMLKERKANYSAALEEFKAAKSDLIRSRERVQHEARSSVQSVRKEYRELRSALQQDQQKLRSLKAPKTADLDKKRAIARERFDLQKQIEARKAAVASAKERLDRDIDYESAVLLGLLEEDIPNKEQLFAKLDKRLAGHRKQVASLRERLGEGRSNISFLRASLAEQRRFRPEMKAQIAAEAGIEDTSASIASMTRDTSAYNALGQQLASEQENVRGILGELSALRGKSRAESKQITELRREYVRATKQYNNSVAYADMGDIDTIVGRIASNIINGDVEMGAVTVPISTTSHYKWERKIRVPQTALMDFSDTNFYNIYKRYITRAATDIEIAKQYGPSLKFRGSESHKRLLAEREALIKKHPELTPRITVEYEKNIRDLENILLRLGGNTPGKKKPGSEGWFAYAAQLQRGISAAAVLGNNAIQVVNEFATLLFSGGLKTAANTLAPSSWGFGRLARHELRSMRLGLHMAHPTLAKRTLRDVLHDYKQNPISRMASDVTSGLASAVQYANFSKPLEFLRVRALTGVLKSNIGFIADKAARGKVRKKDMVFMRALGLSDDEVKEIGRLIREHGRVSRGYYGIENWDNKALASKVTDAINVSIIKRNTAVSKVDLPFIYEHPIMKSVLMFTSWIPAATNKMIIPGIMDHQRELAITAVGYTAVNFATKLLKYQILGVEKDPDEILREACLDNSFLSWGREIYTRGDNILTGLYTNNYAKVARGAIGPAGGAAQDVTRSVYGLVSSTVNPDRKMTNAEFNAMVNLVPAHTMPGLARIFKKRTSKKRVVTHYG